MLYILFLGVVVAAVDLVLIVEVAVVVAAVDLVLIVEVAVVVTIVLVVVVGILVVRSDDAVPSTAYKLVP